MTRRTAASVLGFAVVAFAVSGCNGCSKSSSAPSSAVTSPAPGALKLQTWQPPIAGKHPAIVLLHGAAGPTLFTDPTSDHRRYPLIFAAAGYAVFMPYYAEAPGDPLAVVTRAVDEVRVAPDVDIDRIAVVGYSRGANLALRLVATDTRVAAAVDFYGWLDARDRERITRFPPTLILHGEKDTNVPVAAAHDLERLFTSKKIEFEIHVYPDQEHGFGRTELDDSAKRVIAFLDARLRLAR